MIQNKKPAFKYYYIGTQMIAIILSAIFIGYQLDQHFAIQNFYITIGLATFSILYVLYKLVSQIKKEN
tara:strand:+ start:15 stop:218 length:204 start_codon:yes stop_codon:yes gene_type:complete